MPAIAVPLILTVSNLALLLVGTLAIPSPPRADASSPPLTRGSQTAGFGGNPAIAQSIWKQFTSAEGRFAVLFPGSPSVLKQSVSPTVGQTMDIHVFYLERPQETTTYAVAYSDFPFGLKVSLSVLKQAFDSGRDRMVGSGRLLSDQEIRLGDFPGREFKFVASGGKVTRARMYHVNGRLYQILTETGREKALKKSLDGFFSSFQVLLP